MTDIKKCEINATVGNGQKIKCELEGSVNMKLKGGEMVKTNKVLYGTQTVNNLLILSRLVSKGSAMGATQDKINIMKNGVNMILDARKDKNTIMVFYLRENTYAPKVSKSQEVTANFIANMKYVNAEK